MRNTVVLFLILFLSACQSNKVFENYDLSYSRSGGLVPVYENLLIKGNTAHYFYEGNGGKFSGKTTLSDEEKQVLFTAIQKNGLQNIREDHKKLYDHKTTTIKVKNTNTIKNDGSGIFPQDRERWIGVVKAFEELITSKKFRK